MDGLQASAKTRGVSTIHVLIQFDAGPFLRRSLASAAFLISIG
jgi:hypothetical protein